MKKRILDFAYKMGVAANSCMKIKTTASCSYYSLSFIGEDEFPIPTGLPSIIKVEGETLSLINEYEALELLNSFSDTE